MRKIKIKHKPEPKNNNARGNAMSLERDLEYMLIALEQAKAAMQQGEVPVGAVLVHGDDIVACAHNMTETLDDPTAHAELIAIRQAAKKLGKRGLSQCELYVTVEPCAMCAGAIINARLKKTVFGAHESRTGCMGSVMDISDGVFINSVRAYGGIMEEECSALMQAFFADKR